MKKLKIRYLIVLVIIMIITVSYFIHPAKKSFYKLYDRNDKFSITLKEFQNRPVKNIFVNGIQWKYYSGGNGTKTILFLHGMGGAYDLWWNQIVALESKYKVVTYTLPEEINSLQKAANGIIAILKREKINRIYTVGTSMGGYINQYLFNKYPNLVVKAVMGNTFPPNNYYEKKYSLLQKILPFVPEILIAFIGKKNLQNKIFPAANNNKLLTSFLPSLPFSKKQLINRYSVVIDQFTPDTSNIKIKRISKLIIESDNDPLVPINLRNQIKKMYPEAKVYTFHKQGHFPYINAASQYNNALRKFFNELSE